MLFPVPSFIKIQLSQTESLDIFCAIRRVKLVVNCDIVLLKQQQLKSHEIVFL